MTIIYHYDAYSGCLHGQGLTDHNPLDPSNPLLPAYSTLTAPPVVADRECARFLDSEGMPSANYANGDWVIQPDWRDVPLWSTEDGSTLMITEPNVTPAEREATTSPYPGPGYIWRDGQWQADPDLQYQLAEQAAEQAAEQELASRQAEATAEIARIQPAVDGGYAKPADVALLPQWQRYRYELPDVRAQGGWPESPQWPDKPKVV